MCDNCVHPRERFDGTDYVNVESLQGGQHGEVGLDHGLSLGRARAAVTPCLDHHPVGLERDWRG